MHYQNDYVLFLFGFKSGAGFRTVSPYLAGANRTIFQFLRCFGILDGCPLIRDAFSRNFSFKDCFPDIGLSNVSSFCNNIGFFLSRHWQLRIKMQEFDKRKSSKSNQN